MNDIFQEDFHYKWMWLYFFFSRFLVLLYGYFHFEKHNVVTDISAQFHYYKVLMHNSSISESFGFSLNIVIYHIPHSFTVTLSTLYRSMQPVHTAHTIMPKPYSERCTTIYCAYAVSAMFAWCIAMNGKDEKPKTLLSVYIYFHIYTKRFPYPTQIQRMAWERASENQEKSQEFVCNLKHICELYNSMLLQTI